MRGRDRDQEDRHRDVPAVDDDAGEAHQAEAPDGAERRGQHGDEHPLQAAEREQEHQRDHEERERDTHRDRTGLLLVAHREHRLAREVEVERAITIRLDEPCRTTEDVLGARVRPEVEQHECRALVARHEHPVELGVALQPRPQRGDLFGCARHLLHQIADADRPAAFLWIPHARGGEAHHVLRHHVLELERIERQALHDLQHLGPPHVALAGHDGHDHRVAAAELGADLAIDLDEGMALRQARVDAELGAQPPDAGEHAGRREQHHEHDNRGAADEEARVALEG